MRFGLLKKIIFFFLTVFIYTTLSAQQPAADTSGKTRINILQAKRLNFQKKDSVDYQSLSGDVIVRQELTTMYCDSAIINKQQNSMEAFGHVHINDNDSVNIFSDYARYLGKDKKAYLKGNVRLVDNKGTLTTPDLDYDVNTKTGIYTKGGKLINGNSVLTSNEGFYYGETRDVYFKKKVLLVDPDYIITTDTLLYNNYTNIATFTVPTVIKMTKARTIHTSDGYYDLQHKKAYFNKRSVIEDSATSIVADEIANDDSTGFGEARGNAVYKDTSQGVAIVSDNLKSNRIKGSFLATIHPVMIIKQDEGDSLFLAADTLFSGRLSNLEENKTAVFSNTSLADSLQQLSSPDTDAADVDEAAMSSLLNSNDTITVTSKADTLAGKKALSQTTTVAKDTMQQVVNNNKTILPVDTITKNKTSQKIVKANNRDVKKITIPVAKNTDSSQNNVKEKFVQETNKVALGDSSAINDSTGKLSLNKKAAVTKIDSTKDRYFEAWYHVRIFSDSLQAVGDSLFYSAMDSTFRLYKQPVVWAQANQVSGDTIYLYTENKKPKRMYVFENALAISNVNDTSNYYNQLKGRTLNSYFKDGELDSVRAKGNAESVYYGLDDYNKFIGVNKASSDIIDVYFANRKPQKVVFRTSLKGTTYPMRQVNHEELRLRGFQWLEARRPKSKYELLHH